VSPLSIKFEELLKEEKDKLIKQREAHISDTIFLNNQKDTLISRVTTLEKELQ